MFVHENGTHSSRPTSWKSYPLLLVSPNLSPFQPVFFLQNWHQSFLACVIIIWSINTINFCQVLVRFLWNLKMLYIISLLVIYDTMISLICFFFMLFLIYSFWSSLQCVGFSSQWLCSLWSMGSRATGFRSLWVSDAQAQFLYNMWDLSRPGIEPVSPDWQADT